MKPINKRPKTFRFTEDVCQRLYLIADATRLTQTDVIEECVTRFTKEFINEWLNEKREYYINQVVKYHDTDWAEIYPDMAHTQNMTHIQNGKSKGDPVIRTFKYFTNDGGERKWLAYNKDESGATTTSLPVECDEATLLSYGLIKE